MLGTRHHPDFAAKSDRFLSAEEKRTMVHIVSSLCLEVSKVDQLLATRCGGSGPPVRDARQALAALEALKTRIASLPVEGDDTSSC